MRAASNPWSFHRISELELPVCRYCHELGSPRVQSFFSVISRIGDGHYWYVVLAGLFLFQGEAALPAFRHVLVVGLICHLLYRSLKRTTARVRPFDFAQDGFQTLVAPLDKYSFPSGHTLHAVVFTWVLTHFFPALGWVLIPFTLCVAASRVVLGLHYPTDVVAGALLGFVLCFASFLV